MRVAAEIAPILRGACAIARRCQAGTVKRQILCFRTSPAILDYVNGAELARYSQQGVVTPDHTIRTKNWPLIVPAPEAGKLDEWKKRRRRRRSTDFVARYHDYFARNNEHAEPKKKELDPLPRVILVPGVGLFGLGASREGRGHRRRHRREHRRSDHRCRSDRPLRADPEADMFDVEYWSLEQAKLGKCGGEGAGAAGARRHRRRLRHRRGDGESHGARKARKSRCSTAIRRRRRRWRRRSAATALAIACDVTDPTTCSAPSMTWSTAFGGVDIVVSNAGAAWQGRIGEVDDETLRKSFELNFFAHQSVAQNAVRIMQAQGTGGCLLFNTSKQAVNPGKDFGPYGLPKAATLFLVKQYALDHGKDGIRANAVNADRIRTGLLTDEMVAARAKARGVSRSTTTWAAICSGREVTPRMSPTPSSISRTPTRPPPPSITVDGGNIEASLRVTAVGAGTVPVCAAAPVCGSFVVVGCGGRN